MKNTVLSLKSVWICLLSVLMFLPISVNAKTIEVKSENFVLIGGVRETDARNLLNELETYRSAILQLLGTEPVPEPIRVRIYTAGNKSTLKKLTGRTGIGGVYTTTIDGPVFFLLSQGGFGRGKEARHIALHEYTHHLLAAYTNDFYPRWYNEGLANYLATFEVNKKGALVIGNINKSYGYALLQKRWMPMRTVVGSIRRYPYAPSTKAKTGLGPADFFYAQSWIAVHYIQSVQGEAANMGVYIKLLNANTDPMEAFKTAFKRTPEQFQSQLKAYFKANKFQSNTITHNYDVSARPLHVTVLDKAMAQYHRAEAMRFFSGSNVKTTAIIDEYDKAEALLSPTNRMTVEILAARADLASWENQYDKAQAFIDKALQLAPKNAVVNRTAGLLYIYKNESEEVSVSGADMKLARKHLKRALIANPDDVGSHYYYAKSYELMSAQPSKQGIASAMTALDYYRSINFVESNLMLVNVLIRGGRLLEAENSVNKALVWSHSAQGRANARQLKKYLEQQKSEN